MTRTAALPRGYGKTTPRMPHTASPGSAPFHLIPPPLFCGNAGAWAVSLKPAGSGRAFGGVP